MADFVLAFNQLAPLDRAAAEDLREALVTRTFMKGEHILKRSSVCDKLYFINVGLVKTFFNDEDKEFIMRFFHEKTFFSVLDSFTPQKPSLYNAHCEDAMICACECTSCKTCVNTLLENVCPNCGVALKKDPSGLWHYCRSIPLAKPLC